MVSKNKLINILLNSNKYDNTLRELYNTYEIYGIQWKDNGISLVVRDVELVSQIIVNFIVTKDFQFL